MTTLAGQQARGGAVVAPEGRLDALAASALDRELRQALAAAHDGDIVVDMTRATYVSSSCLRVLLVAARLARKESRALRLCCLSPRVRQVFALAGFDMVFPLHTSRDEALSAGRLGP